MNASASHQQLVLEVYVSDLDVSLAFYQAIGFVFQRRDGDFAALEFECRQLYLD